MQYAEGPAPEAYSAYVARRWVRMQPRRWHSDGESGFVIAVVSHEAFW